MPPDINTRRKMHPKSHWEALKPLIHQLYIEQNQTFTKVAAYLDQNHGLNPTKKQFLRRVKEWGFEKNVKGEERRTILERVGEEEQFEETVLRGRRLDKAKIERWRKREQITAPGSSAMSEMDVDYQDETVEELPRYGEPMASISAESGHTFNPWLSVNFVDSPRLTGLIGALTIELCEDFSDLDLTKPHSEEDEDFEEPSKQHEECVTLRQNQRDGAVRACHSVSFRIEELSTHFEKQEKRRMPGPLDELWPFPRTSHSRRPLVWNKTKHLGSDYALKMKELECQTRLKGFKNMKRSEMVDLVGEMGSIGDRHSELEQFDLAETWCRRVVVYSLRIPSYQPSSILLACLQVVNTIARQSRISEALELHRRLHLKILSLVGPEHELGMISREALAEFDSDVGEYSSETAIYREILQSCLLRFGVRDKYTSSILLGLAKWLNACEQYREAETILCMRVELDCEISDYSGEDFWVVLEALETLQWLARSVNKQKRFEDSAKVLQLIEDRFGKLLDFSKQYCADYYCEKAKVLEARGQRAESEALLRAALANLPPASESAATLMQQLVDLLKGTASRRADALPWMEKLLLLSNQTYGIEHRYSRYDCGQLGFYYAELGQYDDAIHLFKEMVEKLALIQGGDCGKRNAYAAELRGWILEVTIKEMRAWFKAAERDQSSSSLQILTGMFSRSENSLSCTNT
jgi:tetratricopeptide (TPR) repeat protein